MKFFVVILAVLPVLFAQRAVAAAAAASKAPAAAAKAPAAAKPPAAAAAPAANAAALQKSTSAYTIGLAGDIYWLDISAALDPSVIATGFEQNGQAVAEPGQVPSLTSSNNFINFCATTNQPITNGKQITTGS